MITIVLIIQTPKEAVFFRQVFLRANIKIIASSPAYASYIKTLQYNPDIIIMEIPDDPRMHLHFLRIIRGNRAIEQKPFIVYGPPFDGQGVQEVLDSGADLFLARPLDFKKLIHHIGALVKSASNRKYALEEINQLSQDERTKLIDPNVGRAEKIALMRRHIGKLFAFPATVASVLRVSQSEKSGAGELAQVIRSDPAMSAEILKIANSVYFSRGGKRILDIKDAVVRIGFVQTKKIAMSISVFQISKEQNYATGFDHTEYWFHCLAVAVIAEHLTKGNRLIKQEEAFIAGLLHDLGTLLLNEFFNDLFLKIMEKTTNEGIRFIECENDLMGFNHNDLMAELFAEWNFPEILSNDIQYMCRSLEITTSFMKEHTVAAIISVADIIAKTFQIGRSVDCCIEQIPNDVFEHLRLAYGLQPAFLDRVYSELNMYNQILNIDKRSFPSKHDQIPEASSVRVACFSFTNEVFLPIFEYLKTQGYQIALVKSIDELMINLASHHALIITGAHAGVVEDIHNLAKMEMHSCSPQESSANQQPVPEQTEDTPHSTRIMIFGKDEEILNLHGTPGIIASRYACDLRTIDIALRCLLSDFSTDQLLNTHGTLKYKKAAESVNITLQKRRILISHFNSVIREKIKTCFSGNDNYIVEETNDGAKTVNFAKTVTDEIDLLIIDLHIPVLSCSEVIKVIRMLPYHRRAKVVVMVSNVEKVQLIPLVKMGIRDFLSEEASEREMAAKFQEIGFASNKVT